MIGKGYPAPSNTFRWCTDRLKIKECKHLHQRQGLRTRRGRNGTWKQKGRKQYQSTGHEQSCNQGKSSLTPQHASTGIHILTVTRLYYGGCMELSFAKYTTNPWGGNNRDLLAMYRDADAAECPLVIDTSTASCGNSRFGCWVCTVS